MKILVIPDVHLEPDSKDDRMTVAGNFIVAEQPDIIVQMGDLVSLQSLSHHEFGKKSSEGRRYQYDIEAGVEGLDELQAPIDDYNRGKKRKYNPRKIITLGNHEGWGEKEVQNNAKLEFTIDVPRDLLLDQFGWEQVPFKSVVNVEGVNFSHYFPSGNMDKAASGVNVGKTLVDNLGKSCIAGHSHLYREYNKTILGEDGKFQRIWGITAGCYFEHKMFYCGEVTQAQWYRGLVMLDLIDNKGDFNIQRYDMKTLKENYR